MPSPYLVVRAQSGGTAQLVSYQGATATTVGVAAGGVSTYEPTTYPWTNRACVFRGALYYSSANSIVRSVDDNLSNTTVTTFSPQTSLSPFYGPFVLTDTDGAQRIAVVYSNLSGLLNILWSTDGLTWTNTNTASNIGRYTCGIPYSNQIVIFDNFSNFVRFVNPFTLTVSNIASIAGLVYLAVWNDIVYGLRKSGGTALTLYTYVGGAQTLVATIETGVQTYVVNPDSGMFVDPSTGNLIVIARGNTSWKAFEITPAYSVTDVTATMITGGTLASYGTSSKLVGIVIDQIDAVGSAPVISYMIASANTSGTSVNQFIFNGIGTLIGGVGGVPNDTGGTVNDSFPNQNIDSTRNWAARVQDVSETTGTPSVNITGVGSPLVNNINVSYTSFVTRTIQLDAIGGSPATYNLNSEDIPAVPIFPNSVTIHGTISGNLQTALDDGAGAFPVSTLLPSGGTIDYATGAMTGTTDTLDASTEVRAYWSGGTASVQMFRTLATDSYPADVITNAVNPAPLSNPSEGTISGVTNINVPADGTTCTVDIDMTGFSSGDRVNIEPYVF